MEMRYSVIGVSFAKTVEALEASSIAGFLHVTEVDVKRKTLTVLAPNATALPSNFFLLGSVKWMD
jgi:polyribonucleotide 5'-hydroxyl-kinase